jgi:hypothetical protein
LQFIPNKNGYRTLTLPSAEFGAALDFHLQLGTAPSGSLKAGEKRNKQA